MAATLVESGVCKCVNVVQSRSLYEWKGKPEEQDEEILVIKTASATAVEERIRELHPYEVPAILRLKLEANEDYEKWLKTG